MKYSWVPHPQQVKALTSGVHELLYGGARGGGKTDAGLVWLVEPKYITNPNYTGLVIRRNANDLTDWIERARRMYKPLKARITGIQPEIKFPSGAIIRTGHLKDASSYEKYQGHEYQKILIEELTKIPRESDYEKLIASSRSTIPDLPARIFATTNPDGPGHDWVKQRWQCDTPDEKPRVFPDPLYPDNPAKSRTRLYIPAQVADNPTLTENDPTYVSFLNSIQDPILKAQWLLGSWDNAPVEGSYYANIISTLYEPTYEQPNPLSPNTPPKLIAPPRIFDFPINYKVPTDTWWDIGVNDTTSIWFTQTVGFNTYIVDFYEANNLTLEQHITHIKTLPYIYKEHFAPHDINVREWGGGSRLEQARKLGVYFRVVPKLSIADGIESARMFFSHAYFHRTNTAQGITLLKNYRKKYDQALQRFSDTPLHDYTSNAADAFRYLATGWERYRKPKNTPLSKLTNSLTKSPYSYTTRRT